MRKLRIYALLIISLLLFTSVIAVASPNTVPLASGNTIVYITRAGAKYHRDGCGSLSRSQIEITLKEAKALDTPRVKDVSRRSNLPPGV